MELSNSPEATAINRQHNMPMSANYGGTHESRSSKQLAAGNHGVDNINSIINNSNNNISQGGANVLRPDHHHHHQQQPVNTSLTVKKPPNPLRYKECLKNHAANMGGYAVDGCGEFMPSGEEGTIEALKCAACGCHRNFHRREINGSNKMSLLALPSPISINTNNSSSINEYAEDYGHNHHNSSSNNNMNNLMQGFGHYHNSSGLGFLPQHHHLHHHHRYMHSLINHSNIKVGHGGARSAKRFRTKFTMEQREKMFEFSEKLGWRIQKDDEAAVQEFCAEAGVKRHVLKVWMHNNKNTFGKKLLRFTEAFNPLPEST